MVVILLINNKQAKGGTATIVGILLQKEVYCPFFQLEIQIQRLFHTSRYLNVVSSAGTTPFFPPASITMLHNVIRSSI
jgi:hypothetical protein